ncbi:MAG TPA: hypothetical protein VKK31_22260 [Thermoanaerobaculia bacterium]|nr:hypothetical protein [Thermoanaerobaculia bacterium]
MSFETVAKAALELGVVPAIAIALVVYLFLQNRQLLQQKVRTEEHLMASQKQILSDYRALLEQAYRASPEKFEAQEEKQDAVRDKARR